MMWLNNNTGHAKFSNNKTMPVNPFEQDLEGLDAERPVEVASLSGDDDFDAP